MWRCLSVGVNGAQGRGGSPQGRGRSPHGPAGSSQQLEMRGEVKSEGQLSLSRPDSGLARSADSGVGSWSESGVQGKEAVASSGSGERQNPTMSSTFSKSQDPKHA